MADGVKVTTKITKEELSGKPGTRVYIPDISEVIPRDRLDSIVEKMILEARAGSNSTFMLISEKIAQLEGAEKKLSRKNVSLTTVYEIYRQIQEATAAIRNYIDRILPGRGFASDKVSFAIYIEGKRYFSEELKPSWLSKNDKGEIFVTLNKVKSTLSASAEDKFYQQVQEIVQKYYNLYKDAISGMYRGKRGIGGRKSSITFGHVAEAFERHLSEHVDPVLLNYLNRKEGMGEEEAVKLDSVLSRIAAVTYWKQIETPDNAWVHMRHSFGYLSGLAAGDVGDTQVKSAKTDNGATVRLTTITSLKEYINSMSSILNPNVPAKDLAKKIVNQLTESVNDRAVDYLNRYIDDEIQKLVKLDSKSNEASYYRTS